MWNQLNTLIPVFVIPGENVGTKLSLHVVGLICPRASRDIDSQIRLDWILAERIRAVRIRTMDYLSDWEVIVRFYDGRVRGLSALVSAGWPACLVIGIESCGI